MRGGGSDASEPMAVHIGTSLALRVGSPQPTTDPATRAFCYVLDQGRYVVGAASNSGGNKLEWLSGVLCSDPRGATADRPLPALLEEAGRVDVGDLLCLPYLTG